MVVATDGAETGCKLSREKCHAWSPCSYHNEHIFTCDKQVLNPGLLLAFKICKVPPSPTTCLHKKEIVFFLRRKLDTGKLDSTAPLS